MWARDSRCRLVSARTEPSAAHFAAAARLDMPVNTLDLAVSTRWPSMSLALAERAIPQINDFDLQVRLGTVGLDALRRERFGDAGAVRRRRLADRRVAPTSRTNEPAPNRGPALSIVCRGTS